MANRWIFKLKCIGPTMSFCASPWMAGCSWLLSAFLWSRSCSDSLCNTASVNKDLRDKNVRTTCQHKIIFPGQKIFITTHIKNIHRWKLHAADKTRHDKLVLFSCTNDVLIGRVYDWKSIGLKEFKVGKADWKSVRV